MDLSIYMWVILLFYPCRILQLSCIFCFTLKMFYADLRLGFVQFHTDYVPSQAYIKLLKSRICCTSKEQNSEHVPLFRAGPESICSHWQRWLVWLRWEIDGRHWYYVLAADLRGLLCDFNWVVFERLVNCTIGMQIE